MGDRRVSIATVWDCVDVPRSPPDSLWPSVYGRGGVLRRSRTGLMWQSVPDGWSRSGPRREPLAAASHHLQRVSVPEPRDPHSRGTSYGGRPGQFTVGDARHRHAGTGQESALVTSYVIHPLNPFAASTSMRSRKNRVQTPYSFEPFETETPRSSPANKRELHPPPRGLLRDGRRGNLRTGHHGGTQLWQGTVGLIA